MINVQEYVTRLAEKLQIDMKLLHHSYATNTCLEKATLLTESTGEDWRPERCIKAVYMGVDDEICGFIFPEGVPRLSRARVQEFYAQAGLTGEYYLSQGSMWIPPSMERGTCTPFPPEKEMQKIIDNLFVLNMPSLEGVLVDISVGGHGEQAHKTSMHLPYEGIYTILRERFNGKVHKVV
jgi:hypothetical protein